MNRLAILFFSLATIGIGSCEEEVKPTPNPNFVYFMVEDPDHSNNDAFILALTDPDDIAEAREMVTDVSKRKIILAEITKDNKVNYHVNRDLINNHDWSWHIAEFLGFYDNTIEIYDGWPTYVEENYNEWVANTKGSGKME